MTTTGYLAPDIFNQRYPLGRLIGQGTYGQVYQSGDHAIKLMVGSNQERVWQQAISEINLYSRIKHPCVAQLHHWTLTFTSKGLMAALALPLGLDLNTAMTKHGLTFEQMAADMLSALSIIHQAGFTHNDIKPGNCIYYQGRVQLIDFGLAAPLTYFSVPDHPGDIDIIVADPIYTEAFRDPQVEPLQGISVKAELYAVGASLYTLFQNKGGMLAGGYPLSQYKLNNKLSSEQNGLLADLTHYPITQRLSLERIMQQHGLTLTTGHLLETPVLPFNAECHSRTLVILANWLLQLAQGYNLKLSTYFLTLHLIRRCLPVILPQYAQTGGDRNQVQLVGQSCLFLAQVVNEYHVNLSLSALLEASDQIYTMSQFETMLSQVCLVCKGIITTITPWDQAKNLQELPDAFFDLISCDYQPELRVMHDGVYRKDVSIEVYVKYLRQTYPSLAVGDRIEPLIALINHRGLVVRRWRGIEPTTNFFHPTIRHLSRTKLLKLLQAYTVGPQRYQDTFDVSRMILNYLPQIMRLNGVDDAWLMEVNRELQKTPLGIYLLEYFRNYSEV